MGWRTGKGAPVLGERSLQVGRGSKSPRAPPSAPFPGFSRTKPHPQPEGAELADTGLVPGAESQMEEVGKEM